MFLFKNAVELDHVPASLKACEETNVALTVLDKHLWAKKDLDAYERILDAERVARSVFETAAEKREAKGRAEGERVKALAIAKQMLAEGLAIGMIQKFTGLSVEQIEALKKS
ncbi:MAG TPA: hypothetical protein VIH30_01085, partial [Aquirhabdus sp.]